MEATGPTFAKATVGKPVAAGARTGLRSQSR